MKRFLWRGLVGALAVVLSTGMGWAEDGQDAGQIQAQETETDVQAAPAEAETMPAPEPADASPAGLEVAEACIATGIENRAPVGADETFPAGTEKLYCFTKIVGGKEGDEIVHRWMKGSEEVAAVTLKVNGSPWRTFSSKTIAQDAAGPWTVAILQGENVLKTLKFEMK